MGTMEAQMNNLIIRENRWDELSALVVGPECGKKLLVDRLRYDLFGMPARYYAEMARMAAESGARGGFDFSWRDELEQRRRGMTIPSMSYEFRTETRLFGVKDPPGHKYFAKNAISGAATIGVAMLAIAADDSELAVGEDGDAWAMARVRTCREDGSQLVLMKKHLLSLYVLGWHHIIVVVNAV
jgi:translation elongation factor EF-1alpha